MTNQPFPSGLCPRCGKALDDHASDRNGWLCPKVTARRYRMVKVRG